MSFLALSACRADVDVAIDIDESGRGGVAVTAELDDEAATRVGDLADLIAADDLREAGWRVVAEERRVSAIRDVASPAQLERAIEDLSGPEGPFSGLTFSRQRTFARTTVEVAGRVDLTRGIDTFGDEDLERLTGSMTGIDVEPNALALSLQVDLPGHQERWDLPIGAVTSVDVRSTDVNALGLSGVGVAVAAALVLVWAGVRRLRP